MASKLFKEGHCDMCDLDKPHLQNLPCLQHHACQSCAAKIACFGPAAPDVDLHTCPICVITADEDIEPYEEDYDPLGLGFSGEIGNPRTNTPADLVPRQQSPNSRQTFVHLASARLLNRTLDARPKLMFGVDAKEYVNTEKSLNDQEREADRPLQHVKANAPLYNFKSRYNPCSPWAAVKSDSLDSLGSWRSSPGGLTQGDITDMGVLALPQRPTIGSYTQGAVVATEGTLSPRSMLKAQHEIHKKQRKLEREDGSSILALQSGSPTPIPLNVNVLDPSDKSKREDDNSAAKYLFEYKTTEINQEESEVSGVPKKKSLRGMAGPIIPGAVQKCVHPERSAVVSKTRNHKDNAATNTRQKSKQLQFTSYAKAPKESAEEVSDLTGLNDDIEQLLKDASKPPGKTSVAAVSRQVPFQKPVKRNAHGQKVPALMSRYSMGQAQLKKPTPNISGLPGDLPSDASNQSKIRPPVVPRLWNQFSDTDDDEEGKVGIKSKVTFAEVSRLPREAPREAWRHRRQDTPFPTAGISSDEDEEEEIERCTSPVKRVRGPRRQGCIHLSSSNSDDSLDRSSTITNMDTPSQRPKPEDSWEI